VFIDILLVLARGRVIELIPVFSCSINEGMRVYEFPKVRGKILFVHNGK
jgi:cbb3-type cytochrome oxidase cytochrome c subunit